MLTALVLTAGVVLDCTLLELVSVVPLELAAAVGTVDVAELEGTLLVLDAADVLAVGTELETTLTALVPEARLVLDWTSTLLELVGAVPLIFELAVGVVDSTELEGSLLVVLDDEHGEKDNRAVPGHFAVNIHFRCQKCKLNANFTKSEIRADSIALRSITWVTGGAGYPAGDRRLPVAVGNQLKYQMYAGVRLSQCLPLKSAIKRIKNSAASVVGPQSHPELMKGIHIIPYHGPPTPLAEKARRFVSTSKPTPPSVSSLQGAPYRYNDMEEVVQTSLPDQPSSSASKEGIPAPTSAPHTTALQASYAALEDRSHRLRQDVVSENQELKQTGRIYGRHYQSYIKWFEASEASRVEADPSYAPIPALPITVAKVTLYLDHEMTRPKKIKLSEGAESTSTCGPEHAKQVVSALEHHRFDTQHLYPNDPLAQVSLRSDARIKTLQAAFEEKEPERVKK
ncbi:hypothetical protein FB45DRAFT_875800 [Roridomyces roridus]|uniref:Uncharacterized protein n=1 Tax=Roridomyces roridus TaxID=1738132 RepID=A0AAD7F9G1_9AGAR|nr:hypothetical protein FB45DRAFT_875800 [Roridomyces roridus]